LPQIAAHAYGSLQKSFLNKKPFFMCEYAHAMGLGRRTENLADNIQCRKNDGRMVWEFAVIPFIIGQEISVYFWGVMENYRA
jgi:hypothetical protein